MKKITGLLLFLIVILACLLRLYSMGNVPASPDWDEAALGYNAYSILHTGKDEYGKFFPVVLQSFDDYKPALYMYFVVPSVYVLGLSTAAVRLPSVLFGILSVLAVFFIVRLLFEKGFILGKVKVESDILALLVSLLVAVSPWHIQFSRVGFEASTGLAFNLFAILFFLKGLKNKYFLPLSFFCAALSIYVYQSEKVYVPLLFLVLIIVFWGKFLKISKKWIIGSFLLGFVVVLPMLIFIATNPHALARAKGVSIFTDTEKLLTTTTPKIDRDNKNNDYIGLMLDNRRIEYVKAFTNGYLSHFQPNWLFYEGDVSRHHAPYMGLLYLWTLPFILIGLYVLFFSDISRRTKCFIALYILISPIPAAVTIDVPHAVRTINFIPAYDILSALGLLYVIYNVRRLRVFFSLPIFILLFGIIFLNTAYYLNQYFVQLNYFDSKDWQYGWKDAVVYTNTEAKKFDHVVVSNVSPLDQSYIFYLFYLKYDPALYQKEGGTKSGGFDENHTAFGKYIFRPINWDQDKLLKNTLFVGRPTDLPVNFAKTVYYLNGDPAIIISRKYD